MKKYLTFAFFLGAVALTSVSSIAQTQKLPQGDVVASPAVAAEKIAVPAEIVVTPVVPSNEAYLKDSAECHALASASMTEGVVASDEVKAAAFKKCMLDKKYSEEDITKGEAADKEVTDEKVTPSVVLEESVTK